MIKVMLKFDSIQSGTAPITIYHINSYQKNIIKNVVSLTLFIEYKIVKYKLC